ncbi:MAG: hypothetical protein AB1781_08175 [Pseudomonadota bacterium]
MTGWKLENISGEAREAAKQAARREKLAVGEWLSRIILEAALEAAEEKKASAGTAPD